MQFSTKLHFCSNILHPLLKSHKTQRQIILSTESQNRYPQTWNQGKRGMLATEEFLNSQRWWKGRKKVFLCPSPERTAPCILVVRGKDTMMWYKHPRDWDGNRHAPQEGNTEAMRHGSVKRVTFLGWENKCRLGMPPTPKEKWVRATML